MTLLHKTSMNARCDSFWIWFCNYLDWFCYPKHHLICTDYPYSQIYYCTIFPFLVHTVARDGITVSFLVTSCDLNIYGKNSRDTFSLVLDTIFHMQCRKSSPYWHLQIYNYWFQQIEKHQKHAAKLWDQKLKHFKKNTSSSFEVRYQFTNSRRFLV